ALAQRLRVPFADADNFHPPANIAKMSAGIPLDDTDREPWLRAIGAWLAEHDAGGGVASCSALKRSYRDALRAAAPRTRFVHLVVVLTAGSLFVAAIAGLPMESAITSFSKGFGETAAGVGVLIALGAMFGKLLADSGGADEIVDTLVASAGPRALPWAMGA